MTRHGGAFGTTPEHDLNQGFYDENGFDGNIDHALVGEVTYGENGGIRIEARIEAKDVDWYRNFFYYETRTIRRKYIFTVCDETIWQPPMQRHWGVSWRFE